MNLTEERANARQYEKHLQNGKRVVANCHRYNGPSCLSVGHRNEEPCDGCKMRNGIMRDVLGEYGAGQVIQYLGKWYKIKFEPFYGIIKDKDKELSTNH